MTKTTLDAKGRTIKEEITGLLPTAYVYDSNGRLMTTTRGADPNTRVTSFAYNPAGYLMTVTDPLNRTVGFQYDAAGRVTTQTLPDGRTIGTTYDAGSNHWC